jgi:hypothetical protein
MNITTIIVYIIVIFLLIKAYKSEALDIFCPPGCKEYDKKYCGDGKGKYYINGMGNDKDDIPVLLNKIELNANIDENTVKWRRCLVLAIISSILLFLIVFSKLPSGSELMMSILIIFLVFYFSFSFYQWHYTKFPAFNIYKNINILRKKLNIELPELNLVY